MSNLFATTTTMRPTMPPATTMRPTMPPATTMRPTMGNPTTTLPSNHAITPNNIKYPIIDNTIMKANGIDYIIQNPEDPSINPLADTIDNIKKNKRHYSSINGGPTEAKYYYYKSMLDTYQGWSAKTLDQNQWIIINLGKPMNIAGVITQGRGDRDWWLQCVESYSVECSTDGNNWTNINYSQNNNIPFIGNVATGSKPNFTDFNRNTKVVNIFPNTVLGQFIKINVITWYRHISMRVGILTTGNSITTITPTSTRPATTRPATTRPATTRPATTRPATTRPATTRPATTRPATTRPATTRPATTRPATTMRPTMRPTMPPAITKPVTTTPPTFRPITSKTSNLIPNQNSNYASNQNTNNYNTNQDIINKYDTQVNKETEPILLAPTLNTATTITAGERIYPSQFPFLITDDGTILLYLTNDSLYRCNYGNSLNNCSLRWKNTTSDKLSCLIIDNSGQFNFYNDKNIIDGLPRGIIRQLEASDILPPQIELTFAKPVQVQKFTNIPNNRMSEPFSSVLVLNTDGSVSLKDSNPTTIPQTTQYSLTNDYPLTNEYPLKQYPLNDYVTEYPNMSQESIMELIDKGVDIFKLLTKQENKNSISDRGIGLNSDFKTPSTNIYQRNFSGTSNVYSPYLYYNKGSNENSLPLDNYMRHNYSDYYNEYATTTTAQSMNPTTTMRPSTTQSIYPTTTQSIYPSTTIRPTTTQSIYPSTTMRPSTTMGSS